MTDEFSEFFNENDDADEEAALEKVRGRKKGRKKPVVDEALPDLEEAPLELPDISLEQLSTGELPEIVLVDSYDDGQHLLEHVPELEPERVERIEDFSGDFSSDYETSIVDDEDPVMVELAKDEPEQEEEDDDDIDSTLDYLAKSRNPEDFDLDDNYFSVYEQGERDPLSDFKLDEILGDAIDMGASDIHLSADDKVSFSILGSIHRLDIYPDVTGLIMTRLEQSILSNVLDESFVNELELDTSYVLKEGPHKGRRTRLSVGKSKGEIFMVFRIVADTMPRPDELGVTGELFNWITLPNGLVMMNGPTGTGKSTTLASMVQEIQFTRAQKIISLERPIEYMFGTDGKALITQREIGRDARSFASALTSAMRQAPDIIMVGEVRNRLEVNELLRAAETGHLAISTMHTNSAAATINRIKSLYEGDDQLRILASLGDVARGFANQVLLKTPDGESRFAVREVLTVNEEVATLIHKGDVPAIRAYQEENGITMEHALVKAVADGRCTREEALSQSAYPRLFNKLFDELG